MISEQGPHILHGSQSDRAGYQRTPSDGVLLTARFTEADFRSREDEGTAPFPHELPAPNHHSNDPVYEIIGALRDMFGGFVINNIRPSPKAGFLEPTQDFPSVEPLLASALAATQGLTAIYHSLTDRSVLSLNYRAIIVNATSELKGFVLGLNQFDIQGGVNRSELPHILAACIEIEKAMAAHVHRLDIVKSGLATQGQ